MSRSEVMVLIRNLSKSQGFYGRLLSQLEEAEEEDRNEWLDSFKNCKDSLDVVMQIEC